VKDLKGKVAVVTGGASGIGRAMAERFAAEGMKVVLADIEEGALTVAKSEMLATGATVASKRTDVSRGEDVEALAGFTIDTFGAVHVVCNNAGVAVGGVTWQPTVKDWQWVLGVNLWGGGDPRNQGVRPDHAPAGRRVARGEHGVPRPPAHAPLAGDVLRQ